MSHHGQDEGDNKSFWKDRKPVLSSQLFKDKTDEYDDNRFNESEVPLLESKETNPKDIIGSDKVPLGLVPAVTMAYLALGHLEGDLKYGRTNWRESGVRTMIYIDACLRHIEKFKDGEWEDPTTKVPHLANALACLSIIIDAKHADKLNDDRPKATSASKAIDELGGVVKHLKTLHKEMKPVDYLIGGPTPRT